MFLAKKESSENFSEILKKENAFLRLPRAAFIELNEEELANYAFAKTSIESWNFKEKLNEIIEAKKALGLAPRYQKTLSAILEDVSAILTKCFELSDDYRPHEVSLNYVQGVPCTKLHADFLPLRLICTYFGPGTIFLPRESTRYPCLNEGRPNKRVLIKDKPVFQAEPFEILILKGRKFNKGEMKPCAHRSPEVVKGEKRLVLKVDFK